MKSSAAVKQEHFVDEEQDELNYRLNFSDIGTTHLLLKKDIVWLGLTLMVFQALDGFLTSVGISRYGISVEGNPFLRMLMNEFGHVPVLALMKTAAVVLILIMTLLANRLTWIQHAMAVVASVYLFAAIIPWTYILFLRPA